MHPKLLSRPPTGTGAVPARRRREVAALSSQHSPFALLPPHSTAAPHHLGALLGEHSPALSAVLLGKASRAAFRVSGGALAKPMLTKDDSGVVMGFGVGCTGAALSCNGKSLHL